MKKLLLILTVFTISIVSCEKEEFVETTKINQKSESLIIEGIEIKKENDYLVFESIDNATKIAEILNQYSNEKLKE